MGIDTNDLINLAQNLTDSAPGCEASQRAAISRAYYAVYHTAKLAADKLLLPPPARPTGGSHQQLYCRLMECSPVHSKDHLKAKSIGYMASGVLKPYRVMADYSLGEEVTTRETAEAIAKARVLMDKAKCFLA